jgi:hypothetical protein
VERPGVSGAAFRRRRGLNGGNQMRTLFGTTLVALAMLSGPAAHAQSPVDNPNRVTDALTAYVNDLRKPVKEQAVPRPLICNNSRFKGVYAAVAKGEFNLPLLGPLNGPTTRIGRVQVDGLGNSEISAITSLNGVVLKESYEGMYTIFVDCTARVVLNIPFPGVGFIPFEFAGVVSDDFHQMDIMLVNPTGSTVGLTLRRQADETNCSNSDLNGGYTVDLRGYTNLASPPATSFYRMGRAVFDGKGGFVAQTNASTAGAIGPDNFSGSYSVDRSCFFTMSYGKEEWTGIIRDNSTNAVIIVSGPVLTTDQPLALGVVVSGTLTRQ